MGRVSHAKRIARLFDAHTAQLELYASQWTVEPDDCVQEAFLELARQKEWPTTPLAWLYRVVRNRALNRLRANKRRTNHECVAARLRGQKTSTDLTEHLALTEALSLLEPLDRELVILRVWSGLTWQEIANLTNTSSSSAQRKYAAALRTMRAHLDPSCQKNSS